MRFPALAGKARPSRGVAQAGSAPGLGPGGRRFESCLPDHFVYAPSFDAFMTTPEPFTEQFATFRAGAWMGRSSFGRRFIARTRSVDHRGRRFPCWANPCAATLRAGQSLN
ncbi:hypothetical protein SPHINGOAX6_70646 [Sphingomonas sp. AX6]|nr:hypothetical protein SPHINGOAX6_70646 [Sphingomonas sp. AX6]